MMKTFLTLAELEDRWSGLEITVENFTVTFTPEIIADMIQRGELSAHKKTGINFTSYDEPTLITKSITFEEVQNMQKEEVLFFEEDITSKELKLKKSQCRTPSFADVCARLKLPQERVLKVLYNCGACIGNKEGRGWRLTMQVREEAYALIYDGELSFQGLKEKAENLEYELKKLKEKTPEQKAKENISAEKWRKEYAPAMVKAACDIQTAYNNTWQKITGAKTEEYLKQYMDSSRSIKNFAGVLFSSLPEEITTGRRTKKEE